MLAARQVLPSGNDGGGVGINLDYAVVDISPMAMDGTAMPVELDVTHAVQHWILEPGENVGLVVECKSGCEEVQLLGGSEARLEVSTASKKFDVGGRFQRSIMYDIDFTAGTRREAINDCPGEEEEEEDEGELQRQRTREKIRNHRKKGRSRRRRRLEARYRNKGRKGPQSGKKRRKCCRTPMKVPLSSDTGFGFVVRPDFIEAWACRGKCPSGHMPRDAHSDIQNLMRRLEGKHIPRPCCVPARTSSKALLHLDPKRKGKLEVTVWKDIVVEECTCA